MAVDPSGRRAGQPVAAVVVAAAAVVVGLAAVREAVGLFHFYRGQGRLPLWDMAEHAWQGFVLARDLEDGRFLRFLVDANRQDTWPFGYSLLLVPFFLLGGPTLEAATLSSLLLFAVCPLLLVWAACELDEGPNGLATGFLASALFLIGPVPRLFGILVMRELAGMAGTLLAFVLYLRALRRDTLGAYRAAGAAALALFFVKYNYAVLWLLAVAVHRLVGFAPDDRARLARHVVGWAWPWRTRDPRRVAVALAVYAVGAAALAGRGGGVVVYGAVVGATAIAAWWLWRERAAARRRWHALPVPARAALEMLVVPVWLWALSPSPMHVRELVGFLGNRSGGLPALSPAPLLFYLRSFVHDYAPDARLGAFVLAAAAASAIALWRAGEPFRLLIVAAAVQLVAITVHPYRLPRFLATGAPFLLLLGAAGGSRVVTRLAVNRVSWPGLAAAALAAALLVGAFGGSRGEARLRADYAAHSADAALGAVLGYLKEQAPPSGRVAVVGTFGELSPSLVRWTLAAARGPRRLTVVRTPRRVPPDAPADAVRRSVDDWLARQAPDRILGIRVLPSSPYYGSGDFQAFNAWQHAVLDRLGEDPRWRRVASRAFPGLGLEVVRLDRAAGLAAGELGEAAGGLARAGTRLAALGTGVRAMVEFVHQYTTAFELTDGTRYVARAYADQQPGGLWEGWFVFFPLGGGEALVTDRETTQSKQEDVVYWATGITPTYLEGALRRAFDRRPEVRLGRWLARAEREEAYRRAEADVYRATADEALAQARAAEAERRRAEEELRATRPRGPQAA